MTTEQSEWEDLLQELEAKAWQSSGPRDHMRVASSVIKRLIGERNEAPTGWRNLTDAQRADIEAHVRGLCEGPETYDAPAAGWTCFHCGETFKTLGGARLHFGQHAKAEPLCAASAIKEIIRREVKLEWSGRAGLGAGYDFIEKSLDRACRDILKASEATKDLAEAENTALLTRLQAAETALQSARKDREEFARRLNGWLEAFDTGRSEPLYIQRDATCQTLVVAALRAALSPTPSEAVGD